MIFLRISPLKYEKLLIWWSAWFSSFFILLQQCQCIIFLRNKINRGGKHRATSLALCVLTIEISVPLFLSSAVCLNPYHSWLLIGNLLHSSQGLQRISCSFLITTLSAIHFPTKNTFPLNSVLLGQYSSLESKLTNCHAVLYLNSF